MHALFATLPGQGHFLPLVPLARALRQGGHQVSFAASALFVPDVEQREFRCFPAGRPWLMADTVRYFPELGALSGEARVLWIFQNVFAGPPAAEAAADIIRLGESRRFDVLVFDSAHYAGCVAAEALGIPHASVSVGGLSSDRLWVLRMADQLASLREGAGLPSDPDLLMPFRHLFLSPVPALLYGDADLPPTYREVRFDAYEPPPGDGLPDWVEQLPDRPTVYLTLGTVQNKRPKAFQAVIEALAEEELNLVVTTGSDQDPSVLGDLPRNVRAERFIPQNALLPRCAAVISHGGSGTLRAALWFGLPQLLMPFAADQPTNAAICRDLGVAVSLDPATATPESIRGAVRTILHEPGYRQRAAFVSERMRAMPDVAEAVPLLEHLAGDGLNR